MKIINKQRNSRMCIMCGMDNEYGVRAPFYNMEDGSVMTLFQYRPQHQSYPGRVHGGLVTAMLDEMGLRALWAKEGSEETFLWRGSDRKRDDPEKQFTFFCDGCLYHGCVWNYPCRRHDQIHKDGYRADRRKSGRP